MIQAETGTIGTSAYLVTEPDAPDFTVRVTDISGNNVPQDPESDVMLMGSFDAEGSQLAIIEVRGRAGLIAWYVEHVGYSPDEDIGGKTPILELIDNVGSHIALRLQAKLNLRLQAEQDYLKTMEVKSRETLPPGTIIEYCGMRAEVERDYGGDGKLIVRADDGSRVEWRWNFDGESCKVISRPDEACGLVGNGAIALAAVRLLNQWQDAEERPDNMNPREMLIEADMPHVFYTGSIGDEGRFQPSIECLQFEDGTVAMRARVLTADAPEWTQWMAQSPELKLQPRRNTAPGF